MLNIVDGLTVVLSFDNIHARISSLINAQLSSRHYENNFRKITAFIVFLAKYIKFVPYLLVLLNNISKNQLYIIFV